jgi:hypothetical protein
MFSERVVRREKGSAHVLCLQSAAAVLASPSAGDAPTPTPPFVGPVEEGEQMIMRIGGMACLVTVIDVPSEGCYDVQPWGRYSSKSQFHPSWLDEVDDEVFMSERAVLAKRAKGADLSMNWTDGLTDEDVIQRNVTLTKGRPSKHLEDLIGKKHRRT